MTKTNRKKTEYIPWYADEYTGPVLQNCRVRDYLSLTPRDIKQELEKHVVNQEEACRKIAVMMYQHLQGHRFVGLLAGPTGSGKSFIAYNLKTAFPDLVHIWDVSNVTCDGWKGDKKVTTLFKGVTEPRSYKGRVYPLLFLDECDKLFHPKYSYGENVSESIQSEFLSVIHGTEIKIREQNDEEPGMMRMVHSTRTIDTSKISFLFAGAFEKRARAVAEKEAGPAIGFNADRNTPQSYSRELTAEDIQEAGCMAELCGRIQKIVCLGKLKEEDFLEMLHMSDRGPVYELEQEFGIPIRISEDKMKELAHEAYAGGLGIRGIKNGIREYIDELMWENCRAKTFEIM